MHNFYTKNRILRNSGVYFTISLSNFDKVYLNINDYTYILTSDLWVRQAETLDIGQCLKVHIGHWGKCVSKGKNYEDIRLT